VGYLDAVQKQISFGIESTISKQLKTPSASLTKAKQKLLGELDIAFPEYAKARRTYSAAKLNQWAESKLATKRTAAGAQELNFSQQNQALWGSAKNINYWKDEIADIVTDPVQQKEALSKFDDIIRATRVLEKSPVLSRLSQPIDDSIGTKIGKVFTGAAVGGVLAAGSSLANSGGQGSPVMAGILGASAGALLQGKMNKQMLKLLTDPKYIDIIHKGAIKSNKIDIVTKLQSLARAIMTAKAVYEKENGPMDAQEGTPNANQNTALPGQVPTDQPTQP
jgi:hypothetical protein